jgi:hypothetical protein
LPRVEKCAVNFYNFYKHWGSRCGSAVKWWNAKINENKRSRVCSPARATFYFYKHWPDNVLAVQRDSGSLGGGHDVAIRVANDQVQACSQRYKIKYANLGWILCFRVRFSKQNSCHAICNARPRLDGLSKM